MVVTGVSRWNLALKDWLGVFSIGVRGLFHNGFVVPRRLRRIRHVATGERGAEAYIRSYSPANAQGLVISEGPDRQYCAISKRTISPATARCDL